MIIFDHRFGLAGGIFLFDGPLATARTATAAAVKMLVGVQADKEQPIDFAAFQIFVDLESLIDLEDQGAQVLRVKTLADILKGVVTDGVIPMDQMPPAPALGLPGQIRITGNAQDRSQQ